MGRVRVAPRLPSQTARSANPEHRRCCQQSAGRRLLGIARWLSQRMECPTPTGRERRLPWPWSGPSVNARDRFPSPAPTPPHNELVDECNTQRGQKQGHANDLPHQRGAGRHRYQAHATPEKRQPLEPPQTRMDPNRCLSPPRQLPRPTISRPEQPSDAPTHEHSLTGLTFPIKRRGRRCSGAIIRSCRATAEASHMDR
jgi:hypothetical protein